MILTLEDNYGAGIGSAIADAVSADGGGFNVRQMFVRNIPNRGREPDDVLAYLRHRRYDQIATKRRR